MTAAVNIWEEQDKLDAAVETGAIMTHARTGWKFKLRMVTPWSPHLRRATTLVTSRKEVGEMLKRKASRAKMSPADVLMDEAINLEIFVRATIINWSGVTDRGGKAMPCNAANAMTVLSKLRDVSSQVMTFASDSANYGLDAMPAETSVPEGVDASGNSSATSDTVSEDSTSS